MAVKLSIVVLCSLLIVYFANASTFVKNDDQVQIEVGTSYVTRDVQKPTPKEKKTFVASTCKQFIGDAVNVTLLLNSNPEWIARIGVVYFYVVDDPKKPESQALCTNGNPARPYCFVDSWKSHNDLYIMTTAGDVNAISYTVNVQFISKHPEANVAIPTNDKTSRNHTDVSSLTNDDYYYLSEIVHISKNVRLQYQQEVLLNVSFCANSETSQRYTISSEVFGTDGISAYTQYVCIALPCDVDLPNVIKSNPSMLLSNTVILTTTTGEYTHLYVVVVNWGGDYDPTVKQFVGEFQYVATITRNP
ncbi:uncharacterized protein LOC144440067 [Glandiceps talaboti]